MSNRNFMNFNPILTSSREFIPRLIGMEKYVPFDPIVEQVCRSIYNEKDYDSFARLLVEIYQAGYSKSIADHAVALNKIGLKTTMLHDEKESNPIFPKNPPADQ